jgi:mannose-6-phosphate isomerase-like protein (cupin superfamily)
MPRLRAPPKRNARNSHGRDSALGGWHVTFAEWIASMRNENDDRARIALSEAREHLAHVPETFVELFRRGEFSIELFAPVGIDTQQPHVQDEAYVVITGSGVFRRGEERVSFEPGDVLFVAAGVAHAFETFTGNFQTWVIFFGPKGGL